ncbi:PTS fructose-like transporter subunit IIB [Enterovibrio norvegicus]|uniref:protein-N(pi)-phosphohistidine--D-fructose phosphotransferase n=2 Tax=Enterovibrio norvegicus TaxID=188144 RepID=A0A1I5S5R6_9GAMM|nr:PTS fructose transporter subunit IIB [Enterovibrio norvegicus]SFP65981.1 PTS system, fructose-specific IIB-like component [Enterovibrio norvegicus DSM 15893]OEF58578.1 PTS fructose transporter subunit IIB [Enterovibrio norvegicus]PMH65845.1 PTS fructose transporter subunit IIB [Enterovibrio norvegicus]PMI30229.1 PTS fructose transporter subunit IIB [Enterovibrio norvegicus]
MKLIGVTSCPSGVAHTYMAAEALETAAKAKGWDVKIETQGAIGIENVLTAADVEGADVVVLTKDIAIKQEERFNGKKIVRVTVAQAAKQAPEIIAKLESMLAQA